MSIKNLSEEKDWNMLGTLKSLKAVLDDLMEQEGDWDKIYNHFGYMAENETEAKKKLLYFAVESIYALSDSDCENMLVLLRGKANIGSDCKEVVMDRSLDHEEVVIDINPYILSKYLESKEWVEYPIKKEKVKVYQLEKGGERYQVSIPFDKSFSDYHDVMYETIKTIARAEKKTAEQISFYLDNLALGEYIEKYLPDADVKEAKEIYREFERKGEKIMDKFDQIIDDYKKKKLGVDEAVEKLCALDRENISDVEYTDGEAKEARKSAIEMIEGIEDEALLELMYKYMKRVIDEEKEKKNG